jgi:hypothetical protein
MFTLLVITAKPVHNVIHPTSNKPQNADRYRGMYILGKYSFKAMELRIVHMIRIKKGNGTGRLEMALTTLN